MELNLNNNKKTPHKNHNFDRTAHPLRATTDRREQHVAQTAVGSRALKNQHSSHIERNKEPRVNQYLTQHVQKWIMQE